MKKRLLSTLSIFAFVSLAHANWYLTFASGTFFDESNVMIQEEYNFALIVDMNNKGFEDFKLEEGDKFVRGQSINSSGDYMTLVASNLWDPEGEGYYLAYSTQDVFGEFNNDDYGFAGGEDVALVVWDSNDETVLEGDKYVLINPKDSGTTIVGSAIDWTINAGNRGNYNWELYNESIGGDVADSYFTLDKEVVSSAVPEPSTYAYLFGFSALILVLFRRGK